MTLGTAVCSPRHPPRYPNLRTFQLQRTIPLHTINTHSGASKLTPRLPVRAHTGVLHAWLPLQQRLGDRLEKPVDVQFQMFQSPFSSMFDGIQGCEATHGQNLCIENLCPTVFEAVSKTDYIEMAGHCVPGTRV